jgi:hypothetical protein
MDLLDEEVAIDCARAVGLLGRHLVAHHVPTDERERFRTDLTDQTLLCAPPVPATLLVDGRDFDPLGVRLAMVEREEAEDLRLARSSRD